MENFSRISQIENFGVLGIMQSGNFWNFPNWKFSVFSKLQFFGIFQFAKF